MRERGKKERKERKEKRRRRKRLGLRWSKGRCDFFFSFKCSTSGSKGEEPKETKNK